MQYMTHEATAHGQKTQMHARRLCQSSSRYPHPHLALTAQALTISLVHSHVHAIRDHAKQRTRRALHREHVRTRVPRRLEHRARVPPVRTQRTARRSVHVVPLSAPARSADHAGKGRRGLRRACVPTVGQGAPALEGLCERERARGGCSARKGRCECDVRCVCICGGKVWNVPCEMMAVGAAPGVVGS